MSSSALIIEKVPVVLDMAALSKRLGIKAGQTKFEKKLESLARQVLDIARPKAVVRICSLKEIDAEHVEVDGVCMTSTLLPEKMAGLNRVFTFLATEGRELSDWAESLDSNLDLVFAGRLREAVCKQYQGLLEQKVCETFDIPIISCVQPGSLPVWPIEQQRELFQVMGTLADDIGVKLLPSCLMHPAYSVSGIFFQTEKKYYNCMLCPRENCPNRKAPSTVTGVK